MASSASTAADVHPLDVGKVDTPSEREHPGDAHEIPSFEPHNTMDALKDRIKLHYNIASDYYYSLW